MARKDRDIEKVYSNKEFAQKLRRFADYVDEGSRFEIQVAGERISVPALPTFSIEHERSDGDEELEFQIKWSRES